MLNVVSFNLTLSAPLVPVATDSFSLCVEIKERVHLPMVYSSLQPCTGSFVSDA